MKFDVGIGKVRRDFDYNPVYRGHATLGDAVPTRRFDEPYEPRVAKLFYMLGYRAVGQVQRLCERVQTVGAVRQHEPHYLGARGRGERLAQALRFIDVFEIFSHRLLR